MDELQREFQVWAGCRGLSLDRVTDGPYKAPETQAAWEAWKSASHRAWRIVMNDADAFTYQTLGQYRSGMARAIRGAD